MESRYVCSGFVATGLLELGHGVSRGRDPLGIIMEVGRVMTGQSTRLARAIFALSKTRGASAFIRFLLVGALALIPAQMSGAATYVVTNTDGGVVAGSFAKAINDANGNAGADTIEFDIPGAGPHVIDLSVVPYMTEAVTIDGTTQTGYAGSPVVKIFVDSTGGPYPIRIYEPDVEIRGLAFANLYLDLWDDRAKIAGCSFSADATDPERDIAIYVRYGSDSIVGGAGPEDGNQFGKVARGVVLGNSSTGTRIDGNFFGLHDVTSSDTAGVFVEQGIKGSLIGTEAGNTFTNRDYGVLLANTSFLPPAKGITILNNSFHGNAAGIFFATAGSNNKQQPPLITEAVSSSTQTGVSFEYVNGGDGDYLVQFFSNPVAERQGRTFLGETTITTSGAGVATYGVTFPTPVTAGHYVNSTITRLSTGDTSEFSNDEQVVMTADLDGDGVSDETEDAGPNGGDGNDDGTPDSTQANVVTLPTANGNGWMTLIATCELKDVEAIATSALPTAPRVFPYALVEFLIPCSAADLDILYHAGAGWTAEVGYWKYGPEEPGQALTTKWYELPGVTFDTTSVDGATVARARFSLADGVLGDDTGVDGVIVDQGGPGTPLPAASIPTASEWMLIVMAMLLAVAGGLRLRV